jgi:DNA-binding CsgD family transcriptional regulator
MSPSRFRDEDGGGELGGDAARGRPARQDPPAPPFEDVLSLLGALLRGAPAMPRGPVLIVFESDEKGSAVGIVRGAGQLQWANDAGRELLLRRPGVLASSRILLGHLAAPAGATGASGGDGADAASATLGRREAALQQIAARARAAAASWRLTPRQGRVLELAARGLATKEISAELGCMPKTVEVHLGTIFRKVGVDNRAALMAAFWCDLDV